MPHVGYVAYAPDGKSVATHGHDHSVHIWDITQDPPVEKFTTEPEVNHTAVSPDGTRAASICWGRQELVVWDWADGKPRRKHTQKLKTPSAYVLWATGARLLTTSYPGLHIPNGPHEFTLWDVTPDGLKDAATFTATVPNMWQMVVSPDGTRFAQGNTVWDLTATPPKLVGAFKELSKAPAGLDFSPDSKWLVAVSNGQVQLFDASKPEEPPVATVKDPGNVKGVKFSPDGASFLTLTMGSVVIRWERKGKDLVETLRYTHSADGKAVVGFHLTTASFSPDGVRVYLGSSQAITECDAKTGIALRMWTLPGASYPTVSKDGRYLFCSNVNGIAYVLSLAAAGEANPMATPKK